MLKKIVSIMLCMTLLLFAFAGCEKKQVETENTEIANFTMPEENEEIVVLTVKDYGEIKIKLFPDLCPKGVENFTRLIKEQNYYDGVIFHRVIKDFMIQGGDPKGNGTGGNSIWGDGFAQEINPELRHFVGALSYATAADKLNKSQFFIVTGKTQTQQDLDYCTKTYGTVFPENVAQKYFEVGGSPHCDNNYEVFGQVFNQEGLDIIKKISEVETDNNDKPLKQVVIEKAEVVPYTAE